MAAQNCQVKFACTVCKGHIEAPADMAGSKAKCPHCGIMLLVPNDKEERPTGAPPPPPIRLRQGMPNATGVCRGFIDPDVYRYPYENDALYLTLIAMGFLLLVFSLLTFGIVLLAVGFSIFYLKVHQNNILGGCVAITEKQFPEIHSVAVEAAQRLCMPCPPVFIQYSPVINAYALGFMSSPTVVLHSSLVEALSGEELLQVVGHEFSHIKCGHTFWTVITGGAGSIQVPILSQLLGFLFLFWSRRAEYTCDRGGLLCSRSLASAYAAMGKLAVGKELYERLQLDEFLQQASQVNANQFSKLAESFVTHPYLVKRFGQLKDFIGSATYEELSKRA